MNETDWNTPRNGDFVRYVEQLAAESLQRVNARPQGPGAARGVEPTGPASIPLARPEMPTHHAAPRDAAAYAVAALIGLLVLWAVGVPIAVLALLSALAAGLFKRFASRGRGTSNARDRLAGLLRSLQDNAPSSLAGGRSARPNPRRQSPP